MKVKMENVLKCWGVENLNYDLGSGRLFDNYGKGDSNCWKYVNLW